MIELGVEIPLGKYLRTVGTYVSRTPVGKFLFGVSKEVLDKKHSENGYAQYGFHQYAKIDGEWHEYNPQDDVFGSREIWEKM